MDRLQLIESLKPRTGAEVGVCEGEFSQALLTIPTLKKLYLVDAWTHIATGPYLGDKANVDQGGQDDRERRVRNLFAMDQRVEIIKAFSDVGARIVNERRTAPLDFVFLDAGHYYEAVIADLLAWRHLTEYFVVHDFFTHPPTFEAPRAVIDFCNREEWNIELMTTDPYPSVLLMRR